MKKPFPPHIPDPSQYGGAQLPPKHLEVLRVAMRLIAERGYRGASLRELARRVGMQQPSLYHYFESKEDLVEQAIHQLGRQLGAHAWQQRVRAIDDNQADAGSFREGDLEGDAEAVFLRLAEVTQLEPVAGAMCVDGE